MRIFRLLARLLTFTILFHGISAIAEINETFAETPPRLAYIDGQVSFLRQGADDWVPARLNTPLTPGDTIYTADGANLELQIGPRAFVRAAEKTGVGFTNQASGYLQFQISAGTIALDLRDLPAGRSVELDTPNAAFTIDHEGYYRLEISGEETHFISRRGGRAAVTPSGGAAQSISPSEEIVVRGTEVPTIVTYVAPEPDRWDRWNYARTDHQIEALSTRYVSTDVYGVDALDEYGSWRVVPSYGSVWMPNGLASGWAPYSTGNWIWDQYYGWTWVDDAPWGWAPFHYGRWIFLNGYWAWAPGPLVVQPAYAPALVAFFYNGRHAEVRVGADVPPICWVALGWGEPVLPWWGRRDFAGVQWWGGWGGPRNVNIVAYQNTRVPNAFTAVQAGRFGRGPVQTSRFAALPIGELEQIRGRIRIKPVPESLVASRGTAVRPPDAIFSRSTVATRPFHTAKLPWRSESPAKEAAPHAAVTFVPSPKRLPLTRPPFGTDSSPGAPAPAVRTTAGGHKDRNGDY